MTDVSVGGYNADEFGRSLFAIKGLKLGKRVRMSDISHIDMLQTVNKNAEKDAYL